MQHRLDRNVHETITWLGKFKVEELLRSLEKYRALFELNTDDVIREDWNAILQERHLDDLVHDASSSNLLANYLELERSVLQGLYVPRSNNEDINTRSLCLSVAPLFGSIFEDSPLPYNAEEAKGVVQRFPKLTPPAVERIFRLVQLVFDLRSRHQINRVVHVGAHETELLTYLALHLQGVELVGVTQPTRKDTDKLFGEGSKVRLIVCDLLGDEATEEDWNGIFGTDPNQRTLVICDRATGYLQRYLSRAFAGHKSDGICRVLVTVGAAYHRLEDEIVQEEMQNGGCDVATWALSEAVKNCALGLPADLEVHVNDIFLEVASIPRPEYVRRHKDSRDDRAFWTIALRWTFREIPAGEQDNEAMQLFMASARQRPDAVRACTITERDVQGFNDIVIEREKYRSNIGPFLDIQAVLGIMAQGFILYDTVAFLNEKGHSVGLLPLFDKEITKKSVAVVAYQNISGLPI